MSRSETSSKTFLASACEAFHLGTEKWGKPVRQPWKPWNSREKLVFFSNQKKVWGLKKLIHEANEPKGVGLGPRLFLKMSPRQARWEISTGANWELKITIVYFSASLLLCSIVMSESLESLSHLSRQPPHVACRCGQRQYPLWQSPQAGRWHLDGAIRSISASVTLHVDWVDPYPRVTEDAEF